MLRLIPGSRAHRPQLCPSGGPQVAPVEVSLREERGSPAVEMRMSPGGAANAVLQRAMSGAAAPEPLEVSAVVRTASDWAAPPLEMGERRSAMGTYWADEENARRGRNAAPMSA